MLKLNLNHAVVATLTSVAFMSIVSVSSAEARQRIKDPETRATKQFERLDTNDDGVITIDEMTGPAATHAENKFVRKDTDEDGFVSFEEATAGRTPVDYSDIAEDIALCVADIKEETGNEDIVVPDPANYMSPQEKFDATDTSGDGFIDLTEALAKAESNAITKFDNTDTDGDEQITLEEFTAAKVAKSATRRAVKECIDELTSEDL